MFLFLVTEERSMDEVPIQQSQYIPRGSGRMACLQIHVVQPKLLQAGFESTRDVCDVGQDLGRYEKLLAVDLGLADCGTEFSLCLVDLSSI